LSRGLSAISTHTAQKDFNRSLDEPLPFYERESGLSDQQGGETVNASPECLACFFQIAVLDLPFFHRAANDTPHIIKAALSGFCFARLAALRLLVRRSLQDQSDRVMVGMVKSETNVGLHSLLEEFERVALHLVDCRHLVLMQFEKGLLANTVQDFIFVLEVDVDGGGAVYQFFRQSCLCK